MKKQPPMPINAQKWTKIFFCPFAVVCLPICHGFEVYKVIIIHNLSDPMYIVIPFLGMGKQFYVLPKIFQCYFLVVVSTGLELDRAVRSTVAVQHSNFCRIQDLNL